MLFLFSLAMAGVPLVFDGETPEEVIARTAQRTGLPVTQFDPVPLDTLLKSPPRSLGSAVLRFCASTTTRTVELRTNVVRGEAAFRSGDMIEAMDQLDLGIAGLGCLSERVETPVASRFFLLRAAMLSRQGKKEEAKEEMRTALSLGAAAEWPSDFPPEGKEFFGEVLQESVVASLSFVPMDTGASPVIDGQSVALSAPLSLRSGLHLLQVPSTGGLRSAWLTVSGSATLVIPGNLRRPVLERLGDLNGRPEVEQFLLSVLGEEGIYVSSGGALWLVTPEGTNTLIAPPPPPKGKKKK